MTRFFLCIITQLYWLYEEWSISRLSGDWGDYSISRPHGHWGGYQTFSLSQSQHHVFWFQGQDEASLGTVMSSQSPISTLTTAGAHVPSSWPQQGWERSKVMFFAHHQHRILSNSVSNTSLLVHHEHRFLSTSVSSTSLLVHQKHRFSSTSVRSIHPNDCTMLWNNKSESLH